MEEAHQGCCGDHAGGRSLARRLLHMHRIILANYEARRNDIRTEVQKMPAARTIDTSTWRGNENFLGLDGNKVHQHGSCGKKENRMLVAKNTYTSN